MQASDGSGVITLSSLPSGIYDAIVIIEDTTGCSDNFQIELICLDEDLKCFKTKKFFTPNNDGYNDFWSLDLFSNSCNYKLYIYNRYGKLLKTLTPMNSKWNGTFAGQNMPSDDYWYTVEYKFKDINLKFSSHFTLKR